MRSAISELIARPNARGRVGYARTYVKIWLRGLRLDRPPGWGGASLEPERHTYVRTYTSVRTRARAWREGTISLSFSGLGTHAYVRTTRAHTRVRARAARGGGRRGTYVRVRPCVRAYVHGERAPYLSLSPGSERTHTYVRTYVRMCLRAHVRRFLPNASNQTPARIPVNAAAGRRKGAEIDRRKGAVRERELVRELRGEMSIGERGASLCEP